MTADEQEPYQKLFSELRLIAARLADLSDCGFSDMEGADMPGFAISEELYGLTQESVSISKKLDRIEALLK